MRFNPHPNGDLTLVCNPEDFERVELWVRKVVDRYGVAMEIIKETHVLLGKVSIVDRTIRTLDIDELEKL